MQPKLLLLLCSIAYLCTLRANTPNDVQLKALEQKLLSAKPDTAKVNLLNLISRTYTFKPGEEPADLKAALQHAQRAAKLAESLQYNEGIGDSYLAYAYAFAEKHDRLNAIIWAKKAILLYEPLKLYLKLGEAYHQVAGHYTLDDADLAERILIEQKALSYFLQTSDKKRQAECYQMLGDLKQVGARYQESLDDLKQSLQLFKQVNHKDLQGVYDLIGQNYMVMGNLNEGLRYGLMAIQTAEKQKDTSLQLATIYYRVGTSYFSLHDLDNALLYFRKSLTLGEKYNDMGTIISLTISLAHTYLKVNKPKEALTIMNTFLDKYHIDHPGVLHELDNRFQSAYLQLKDYEKAAKYTARIKASLNNMNVNSHTRQASCIGIIGYYLETHVYDSVARYLKIYTTFPATDKLADRAKLHLWWFQVDSAQGRYLSAIRHYQQCRIISDSMYNIQKTKELAEMQVRFDTEKKDHDLDTKERSIQLLTKEKQLQESHLKEAKLLRNITFGGLALMGIIAGLLYNRYRLKQKSNRILEAKQKEINDKNDSLQKLVTEKEWLLKEIHHRVKNNLHIVMSLLNTQSAYLKDEAALQAIQDSQHRVHSMSLLHQKLYQTDNVSAIDMPVYIAELVNYLKESFQGKQYIHFGLDIDKIELDVSQAVPIGLILNEAITNAIKYAFPEGHNGHIAISMKRDASNKITLRIQDDGIGLPEGFDITQTHSLGMSLMQGLSEDVDGGFTISGDKGTIITISFIQEQTRHYAA